MRFARLFVCGLLVSAPALASAASAHDGAWAATGCGSEPSAPAMDVSSVDKYNSSVDRAAAYEKAARAYNSCVAKEATKQETAVSAEAREKISHIHEGSSVVQKRIAANFAKITTTLKAGNAKFKK